MQRDTGKFITICDGLYAIATNVLIEVSSNASYKLIVTFDGKESSSAIINGVDGTVTTLNIFQTFKWTKGIVISLKIQSSNGVDIKVLSSSTWSMGFLGESVSTFNEFSSFLTSAYTYSPSMNFRGISVNLTQLRLDEKQNEYNQQGQFYSPPDLLLTSNHIKFQVKTTDYFFVSTIIHVQGDARDIFAVIGVSIESGSVVPSSGISGRFTKQSPDATSMTLSGILLIEATQFASVFVKANDGKQFTLTKDSFLSVINMRYIVSSVGAHLENSMAIASNNWQMINSLWATKNNGLYSFGNDFNQKLGIFTTSHSGIHDIHANIQFQLPGSVVIPSSMIEAAVVIDDYANVDQSFYAVMSGKDIIQVESTLKLNGALNLRAGQTIFLQVRYSDGSDINVYILTDRTSFCVSYIGPEWVLSGFISSIKNDKIVPSGMQLERPVNHWIFQNDSLFDGLRFVSNDSALFIVSATLIITNIMCSMPTTFHMALVTTGGIISKDINIGLQDQQNVVDSGHVTLSVSSAIKLDVSEKIGVSLQLTESTTSSTNGQSSSCMFTISKRSTFSLVKWSDAIKNGPHNVFKNVGILARTKSETDIQSDGWNQLGQTILEINPGSEIFGQPKNVGIFLIGENFVPKSSDFDIQQPGIFFISGSVSIKQTNGFILSRKYEISVQIDNQDVNSGLYSSVKANSFTITLTFAGTIYLTAGQRVRVAVRGEPVFEFYTLNEGSVFSLLKLQLDYKTPGIIVDKTITSLFAPNSLYNVSTLSSNDKTGLALRYNLLCNCYYVQ